MPRRLEIPGPLLQLLSGSPLEAPTLAFADEASKVLGDNKTPFFPAYTDHGIEHIEGVLATCVRLIPDDVLAEPDLLQPADAAVLVCAVLLHDIAMHLREPGFVELVSGDPSRAPLAWFKTEHDGRAPDLPWAEQWEAFQREARHLGQSQLDRLLGPANAGVPDVAHQQQLESGTWTDGDRLLIGEFVRRHHARLSHEIARQGFPGAGELVGPLPPEIADAAGVVARSHGEPLRRMLAYLDYKHEGNLRPAGAVLPYLMGLLRVADYLQLDAPRAPAVLLRLRDPQNAQSVLEWNKHGAVADISWEDKDPLAIRIAVNGKQSLRTHLALDELFAGLERELDTTTAVLSEVYRSDSLKRLRLSKQRLRSNLHSRAMADDLPFVPRRAALRSDEDLFRLVIDDLYGRQPAVAGRELTQNAVDAVRERHRLELLRGRAFPAADFRAQDEDVVVALEEHEPGAWLLRVTDRGVGMTPATVVDYFLRAGASFGPTRQEREDLSGSDAVRVMKTGRFGVGAFAAFLLGPELRVTTRHVGADQGVTFTAGIDEDLVELRWCDGVPFGTEVVVPVAADRVDNEPFMLLVRMAELYCLEEPVVAFRLLPLGGAASDLSGEHRVPSPGGPVPPSWRSLSKDGFDGIFWTPDDTRSLVHNGMAVREPDESTLRLGVAEGWRRGAARSLLFRPSLAVFDTKNLWPLALHRYWPRDALLPFEDELLEQIGWDLVAFALADGPRRHPLGDDGGLIPLVSRTSWLPVWPALVERYCQGPLFAILDGDPGQSDLSLATIVQMLGQGQREETWAFRPQREHRLGGRAPLNELYRWSSRHGFGDPRMTITVTMFSRPADERPSFDDATTVAVGDHMAAVEVDADQPHPELQATMVEVAAEVLRCSERSELIIAEFRIPDAAREPDLLAAPWITAIGGPMPIDPETRAALTDQVLARHPELEHAVRHWQSVAEG